MSGLNIVIENVRTTKEDPDSSKRFCAGTLKVSLPTELIERVEGARENIGASTLSDLAVAKDVTRNANSFTGDLSFSVQPTDDGTKLFSEIEAAQVLSFLSDVVTIEASSARIEASRMAEEQAESAQLAEREAAASEQRAASLNAASVDNRLANQTLKAVWDTLGPDGRAQMLAQQRAWIRKKDADCKVESSSVSTEAQDVETARLNCDTRLARERAMFLRQNAPEIDDDTADATMTNAM